MKDRIKLDFQELDYSLHDAKIMEMVIDVDAKDLLLITGYGYVDLNKNDMVDGNILLQDISPEDSYVYMMQYTDVLCGNVGHFVGEKMELGTFLDRFQASFNGFDVMEEYHGYRTFMINGFLMIGRDIYEATFELYYRGNFIYQVME